MSQAQMLVTAAAVFFGLGVAGLIFFGWVCILQGLARIKNAPPDQAADDGRIFSRTTAWLLAAAVALVSGIMCLSQGASPLIAALPAGLILVLPNMIATARRRAYRGKIEAQLPGAARGIASAVKAGLTLVQAIEHVAGDAPEPLGAEMRRIQDRWRLGSNLADAVNETRRRLNLSSFNLFAAALQVNRVQGGDLSATLSELATALEMAAQCRGQVLAATSEGRTTVCALALIPFGLFGLLLLIDFDGTMRLLTTARGQIILFVSSLPGALGILLARKIMDVKV